MAVMSAIESAVIHLIAEGVQDRLWNLADGVPLEKTVLADYLNESVPMM